MKIHRAASGTVKVRPRHLQNTPQSLPLVPRISADANAMFLSRKGVLTTRSWVNLMTLTSHYYKTFSRTVSRLPKQKATQSEQDVECNENHIKGPKAEAAIYASVAS